MKAYIIKDDIRRLQGKNNLTSYEYSFERDKQVRNRVERYRRQGYNVKVEKNWWTTTEIKLVENEK